MHLGGLERVVRGEVDVEEEAAASIGRIVGTHDGGLPVEVIALVLGASGAVGRRVLAQVDKFLLNSLNLA